MSFPRYERYKESGVEWLGKVPDEWEVKRLGYFFNERREKVSDKDFEALSVTKNGILPQLDTAAKSDDGDNRKKVCVGDFVINSRSDRKGSSGMSPLNGSVSLINTVLKPYENIDANFSHHLFRSVPFQEEYYRYGKGIVADLWSTNYSEMRNITLSIPPLPEQQTIAAFLDRETSKIDELVAEQERLIDLLKEKRQAVISHAVTKGLNPDAPMKDSGIEWLGEVPVDWDCGPLKRFAQVIDCKHYTVTFLDNGWPIVSIRELKDDKIDLSNAKMTSKEDWDFLREGRIPSIGDMIFCRNASVGALGYVETDEPFCMGQDVCLIRPNFTSKFMHYLLTSRFVKEQIEALLVGATIRRANVEEIRNLVTVMPPPEEQFTIVTFLDNETAKIDTLVGEAQQAISLLKERRSALISAAVTGKIKIIESDRSDKSDLSEGFCQTDLSEGFPDECDREDALTQTKIDLATARFVKGSAEEHITRLKAML